MELTERIRVLEEKLRLLEFQNQTLQNKIAKQDPPDSYLFQNLFLNMRNACVIYVAIDDGEDFLISDINHAFIKLEGGRQEDFIGVKVSIAFQPNLIEFLGVLKRVYQNGKKENFIFQYKNEKGKITYHSNDVFKLGPDKVVAIFEDVSPLIEKEADLLKRESRFRPFFENNMAAMLQIDPASKQIVDANAAALKFYDYSIDQFKKLKLYDINILSSDEIDRKMKEVMDSPSQKYIFIHQLASGNTREVEIYVSSINTDTGYQLFFTIHDVSEREANKRALEDSEHRLKEAQNIAKIGNWEYDFETKKMYWSDEVCRIFGFDLEDKNPSHEKYRKQIHPEDIETLESVFKQALKDKSGYYSLVYRIICLSNEIKYIEEKGYFVLDKNKIPIKVIGTMQDITTHYLIKKDLEESKVQLAIINKNLEEKAKLELAKSREKDHLLIQQSRQAVLGEMIGNIAHQWRQPLNEVSLLINDLEDAYAFGVLNKEYFGKTMGIVYKRLKYMSDTINDFSKMHTDDFKREVFYPKELLDKLLQFSGIAIKKNKNKFDLCPKKILR